MVWRPDDAPIKFQKIIDRYSDVDWVALVPRTYAKDYLSFLEHISTTQEPYRIRLSNRDELWIGMH